MSSWYRALGNHSYGSIIVTRNDIVWKSARGLCLCYCKTLSLVLDPQSAHKKILRKSVVHYLHHLKYYRSKENQQHRKTLLSMIDV